MNKKSDQGWVQNSIEKNSEFPGYISWFVLPGISILLIFYLWISQLTNALFVDEAGSSWMISAGLSEVFARTLKIQGHPPLYFLLLWGWVKLFGTSEIALRSLSVLAAIGVCILFLLIGRNRHNLSGYLIALPVLITSPHMVFAATMARPYSLGILAAIISVFLLQKWLASQSMTWLLLSSISLSASFYCHPTLVSILCVHLFLIMEAQPSYRNAGMLVAGATLSLLLISPQIYLMVSNSSQIIAPPISAAKPSLATIAAHFFSVPLLFVCALLGSLKLAIFRHANPFRLLSLRELSFGVVWYLCPKLLTLAGAVIFNASFLIERYSAISVLGQSIVIGLLIASLQGRIWRGLLTAIVLSVTSLPYYLVKSPDTAWRPALDYIYSNNLQNRCRIFAQVGLIETSKIKLVVTEPGTSFISSPLHYYGLDNVILLPLHAETQEEKDYFEKTVFPKYHQNRCNILLAWNFVDASIVPGMGASTFVEYVKNSGAKLQNRIPAGIVSLFHWESET